MLAREGRYSFHAQEGLGLKVIARATPKSKPSRVLIAPRLAALMGNVYSRTFDA